MSNYVGDILMLTHLICSGQRTNAEAYAKEYIDANELVPLTAEVIDAIGDFGKYGASVDAIDIAEQITAMLLLIVGDIVREARGGVDEELF